MRRICGIVVVLVLWLAATIGLNIWFGLHQEPSTNNLILSIGYMVFLLVMIALALPLHSRLLAILILLYGLTLGVFAVATFLGTEHWTVQYIGAAILGPYEGLFWLKDFIGMGSFAVYGAMGCYAAFLTLSAGVGACMVQSPE